jgi:hypothetical protein
MEKRYRPKKLFTNKTQKTSIFRHVKQDLSQAKHTRICVLLIKMTNEMQLCRIIYYSIIPCLLYMFKAILSLIIRSILTVITTYGFIHMYTVS